MNPTNDVLEKERSIGKWISMVTVDLQAASTFAIVNVAKLG